MKSARSIQQEVVHACFLSVPDTETACPPGTRRRQTFHWLCGAIYPRYIPKISLMRAFTCRELRIEVSAPSDVSAEVRSAKEDGRINSAFSVETLRRSHFATAPSRGRVHLGYRATICCLVTFGSFCCPYPCRLQVSSEWRIGRKYSRLSFGK
jgi:hypothetical protein